MPRRNRNAQPPPQPNPEELRRLYEWNFQLTHYVFKSEARRQKFCARPDCPEPANKRFEPHHVVYEQHVVKEGLSGLRFDPRNCLRLCIPCHKLHHHPGVHADGPIPLRALRDENIEFAIAIFGVGKAYNYLTRRYRGTDARVEALLEAA